MNSQAKCRENQSLFMIDNDWKNYDHRVHLKCVKFHRPHIATVRDIESSSSQAEILDQAWEISRYCDRVLIIPKCKIIPEFWEIPTVMIGLPLGRCENKISWDYAKYQNLPIHLLGGSPYDWALAIQRLGGKVYSLDGNYLCKISGFGKIWKDFKSRKPHRWEVKDGKDYNYRCFQFSLENLNLNFQGKQLELVFPGL